MAWQVYVFPHALSTHAEAPEAPEEVEKDERSTLHKALFSLIIALLLAVCIWITLHYS